VSTGKPNGDETEALSGSGGPSPFTEEELASVAPRDDEELEDVDAAVIDVDDAPAPDLQSGFEKLQQKSRKLSPERVRTVIQSLLFVSDRPLTVDQLYEATAIDRERIQEALEKTTGELRDGISGIVLHEVGGAWQLRTDPGSAEYVRRFLQVKPQRLTRSALETLAIVAYRQPVTRPEVEDLRGVDSGAVIKALLDRKLIKILGKKDEIGRPMLYGTTREFLEFFALKDLAALPTLREFQELTQEHQDIVEEETAPPPGAAGLVEAMADPDFMKKMEKGERDSQKALEKLEAAMNAAEDRTREAVRTLEGPATETPDADDED